MLDDLPQMTDRERDTFLVQCQISEITATIKEMQRFRRMVPRELFERCRELERQFTRLHQLTP